MDKEHQYSFYVLAPGDRPEFGLIQEFVWEDGGSIDTDTDGNAYPRNSTNWTELTVETRDDRRERIDVDPIHDRPLILKIRSAKEYLAARAAYALAVYTGGGVSTNAGGPFLTPDVLVPAMGKAFDLSDALRRNAWLKKPTHNRPAFGRS